MMSLAQYEDEQDEGQKFNDAFDLYIEENYTEVEEGLYFCPEEKAIFQVKEDDIGFDDENGFYDYKITITDYSELAEIILRLADQN
jgi:hypothetical protein